MGRMDRKKAIASTRERRPRSNSNLQVAPIVRTSGHPLVLDVATSTEQPRALWLTEATVYGIPDPLGSLARLLDGNWLRLSVAQDPG